MNGQRFILGTGESNGREVTIPYGVYLRLMQFCLDMKNGSFTMHINNGSITDLFEVREVGRGKK